jgi:hypothetical protein
LIVARDIGVMSETDATSLLREVIEVRRMIHGLLKKISNSAKERTPVDARVATDLEVSPSDSSPSPKQLAARN